jgi:hypothetical protein
MYFNPKQKGHLMLRMKVQFLLADTESADKVEGRKYIGITMPLPQEVAFLIGFSRKRLGEIYD